MGSPAENKFTVCYLFMGKYYDSEQKEAELFLEEFREHIRQKNVLVMEREEAVCFYLFL